MTDHYGYRLDMPIADVLAVRDLLGPLTPRSVAAGMTRTERADLSLRLEAEGHLRAVLVGEAS